MFASLHFPKQIAIAAGCGCGLASLALLSLQCSVIATDFQQLPLQLLTEAARRQGYEKRLKLGAAEGSGGGWRITGWWFGTLFTFPYIGNKHPNWLSYFSEELKPPTRLCVFFLTYGKLGRIDGRIWWHFFGNFWPTDARILLGLCPWILDFGQHGNVKMGGHHPGFSNHTFLPSARVCLTGRKLALSNMEISAKDVGDPTKEYNQKIEI